MTERTFDDGVRLALKAAFLLIGDDALQRELIDEEEARSVLKRFHLPDLARPDLLNIVGRVGHRVSKFKESVDRLSRTKTDDVQGIAASQIAIVKNYYDEVLLQARRSFRWALVSAGIGLVFFLAAVAFLLIREGSKDLATVSVISGSLIEVISAINFHLYGKTSAQLSEFHRRLGITQGWLLANSFCEGLDGDAKQKGRLGLVQTIAAGGLIPEPERSGGDTVS